jgi:hypothetical protein
VTTVTELDAIAHRIARLQERLASAIVLAAAAAAAALLIPAERGLMLWVAVGAAGWTAIELLRLGMADGDRIEALDALVLSGSRDPRCERRRAELRSRRAQRRVARLLRETCAQAHDSSPSAGWWILDRHAVRAVEADLRDLAATFDRDAGLIPPEAVVRTRMLIVSPASPLCAVGVAHAAEARAIADAEAMIARCRAELHR